MKHMFSSVQKKFTYLLLFIIYSILGFAVSIRNRNNDDLISSFFYAWNENYTEIYYK